MVQFTDEGIQSRRLSAAGGAGEQDDSVGRGKHFVKNVIVFRKETDLFAGEEEGSCVQNPDDELFPVNGRQGRNPEIIVNVLDFQADSPSWGCLFSAMFSPAIILSLVETAGYMLMSKREVS